MKTLILIRHAEARSQRLGQSDFDRVLSPRGEDEAQATGAALLHHRRVPELIVSSSAARTTATAHLIARRLKLPDDALVFERQLYATDYVAHLHLIATFPDTCHCIALIGHNPTISDLAGILCERHGVFNLKTGHAVCIDFPADSWQKAVHTRGTAQRLTGMTL